METVNINRSEMFEYEFKDINQNLCFLNSEKEEFRSLSVKYNNNFSGWIEIITEGGLYKKNIVKHKKTKPVMLELNFQNFKSDFSLIDLNTLLINEINIHMEDLSGGQLSILGFEGKKVIFKFE